MANNEELMNYVVSIADDHLILGQRVSEWCGHAPILEEDLALPNISLDLIGQARLLYTYVGELEGKGRDEDAIALTRKEREYKNLLLVERPNGDFAHTMLRILYFAVYMDLFWTKMMETSDETLRAIAVKAHKETLYHVRHAGEWVIRMGDGTDESARRMADAVEDLAPYTGELFESVDGVAKLADATNIPNNTLLKDQWAARIRELFEHATLNESEVTVEPRILGGRSGLHGEEMGHILAEMQYMQHAYPNMEW